MRNNLKSGIILTYVTIFVQFATAILYTPVMLSYMGQQQYGLYNMGASVIGYLSLAELGFGNAVVRYAARYRALGNKENERNLYGLFQYIYLILSMVVLLVGCTIAFFSDRFFKVSTGAVGYKQLKIVIIILVLNLAFGFATVVFSSIITAYERFTFIKVTNIIYLVLKPIVMIPLLVYGYKAIAMSIITFILTVILNLGNIIYVKKVLHIKLGMKRENIDFSIIRGIISYSGFIFLASVASTLTNSTDQVILGITSGEMVVAVYSIAFTVIGYAQQFPSAISAVFFPRINIEMTTGVSMTAMTNRMISVGRLQLVMIGLVYGGFVIFGQEFIRLWAGESYDLAYWIVLVILLPSSIPNIQSLGVQIIQATEKFPFKAKMDVICAVVNVVFSIPAAIYFGAVGCAACTGISIVITKGCIMNWYYKRAINLEVNRFWKEIFQMCKWIIPICALGFIGNEFLWCGSWRVLAVKISLFALIYIFVIYYFVLNEREKAAVGNLCIWKK